MSVLAEEVVRVSTKRGKRDRRPPVIAARLRVFGFDVHAVEICADLMWTAYNLFREKEFTDFGELRKALEGELGELGGTAGKGHGATKPKAPVAAQAPTKDFDDADDDEDDDDEDDEDDEEKDDEDFDDHH